MEEILESAKTVAFKDRMRFADIYDMAEEYMGRYAAKNVVGDKGDQSIILGGSMCIDLLLKNERSLDDFIYELYSEMALYHANDLTNAIAQYFTKEPNRPYIPLVFMKTTVAYQKYQIYVDNRSLIVFYKLKGEYGPNRSLSVYDVIRPVKLLGYGKKHEILCLPPE